MKGMSRGAFFDRDTNSRKTTPLFRRGIFEGPVGGRVGYSITAKDSYPEFKLDHLPER